MHPRALVLGYMLFAILYSAVVGSLVLALTNAAHPAEMNTCKVYATRSSAEALRRLVGIPFIDVAAGRFLYRKAYTYCLNADEAPPIVVSETVAPLLEPGSVGATADPTPSPPSKPAKPDQSSRKVGRSGFVTGSDEWTAWCKKNYTSFKESDGSVLRKRKRGREPCPG